MRKSIAIAAATGLTIALSSGAMAQNTPGLKMQEKGSVSGSPGASGYAPGHQMQQKGSVSGTTGASGYAPGRATTGSSVKSDTSINAGGAKARTDIDAGAKIKR